MIHKNETLHSVPLWEIHIHMETQELIISITKPCYVYRGEINIDLSQNLQFVFDMI